MVYPPIRHPAPCPRQRLLAFPNAHTDIPVTHGFSTAMRPSLAPDSGVATRRNRVGYLSSSRLTLGYDKGTSLSAKPMCDGYTSRSMISRTRNKNPTLCSYAIIREATFKRSRIRPWPHGDPHPHRRGIRGRIAGKNWSIRIPTSVISRDTTIPPMPSRASGRLGL